MKKDNLSTTMTLLETGGWEDKQNFYLNPKQGTVIYRIGIGRDNNYHWTLNNQQQALCFTERHYSCSWKWQQYGKVPPEEIHSNLSLPKSLMLDIQPEIWPLQGQLECTVSIAISHRADMITESINQLTGIPYQSHESKWF